MRNNIMYRTALSELILALAFCVAGCSTDRTGTEVCSLNNTETSPVADGAASEKPKTGACEIGRVVVSEGELKLDRGTENGLVQSQVVTICTVVVQKESKRVVPLATARIAPSRTSSTLNLNTAVASDEDGDLIVREFRANPVQYAQTHRLVAVSGTASCGGLVADESERGTVVNSSIIKE